MKLELIEQYADELKTMLKQYCLRLEIAGSVRRKMADCHDIDIVCIPDRFRLEQFLVLNASKLNIRFTSNGQKCKRFVYKSVHADLYITTPEMFGWIYFLRTGSKEWNIRAVNRLKGNGYLLEEGKITGKLLEPVLCREEEDVFALLKCSFIEPERRK